MITIDRVVEKKTPDIPAPPEAIRVAAYARVSTGKDAMLHSLSAQVSYYSTVIQNHRGWLYCGVYSDEAKTGTKPNRPGFQQMLSDCRAGKINLIITKSISRFSRNTVVFLETIRELKGLGIDVFFEEQNLHTLSADGEFILTILSSYAQEESLSVSENQKWRIRKNFQEGKPGNSAMLGYRNVNGTLTIVPEEAVIVRRIFDLYLSGKGIQSIANTLNKEGYRTRLGALFKDSGIHDILRNQAYSGNLLLQKTYRENHITKRTMINRGELPMYYAENTHEAIIPPNEYKKVREIMAERAAKYAPAVAKKAGPYPFTSLITCAKCGRHFRRKIIRNYPVWICPTYNKIGKFACSSKQIPEKTLEEITADLDMEQVTDITADDGNLLVFHLKDGRVIEKRWADRSRSKAWTNEMRQQAGVNAKARYQKNE